MKRTAILTAGVGAGLFTSHMLSEFIPDALGIGLGMGCCLFLAGCLMFGTSRRP